jgi:hypothetical protein
MHLRGLMVTVELLLRLADESRRADFDAALAAEARRTGETVAGVQMRIAPSLVSCREAARSAGEPLADFDALVQAGGLPPAYARVSLTSFDSVLEIRAPDEVDPRTIVNALEGLSDRFGSIVDGTRSCALMGTEHAVIAGTGPVLLFYCFRRRPPVTHDEFIDYWKNKLVEQTTKTPAKTGYIQLHVDPELSHLAAEAAGFAIDDYDGVALEWYPDMRGFMTAVKWASEPDAAIIESEANINDFVSSMALVSYLPR